MRDVRAPINAEIYAEAGATRDLHATQTGKVPTAESESLKQNTPPRNIGAVHAGMVVHVIQEMRPCIPLLAILLMTKL